VSASQNGIDAIRMIREITATQIPAVIITGDHLLNNRDGVGKNGFQVLHKPISPKQLLAVLHDVVTRTAPVVGESS